MDPVDRVEKFQGVTLVVRAGWISVVWDATGHIIEGPVKDEDDVRRVARLAVDALRLISKS